MPLKLYIADPDAVTRDMLAAVLTHEGYDVQSFGGASQALTAVQNNIPACLILDTAMSTPEMCHSLQSLRSSFPVCAMMSGSDVALAVKLIKSGVYDVLQKPLDIDSTVKTIGDAILFFRNQPLLQNASARRNAPPFITGLTTRERDVLKQITDGASNKEAGRTLGISPRTVEVHRARIMDKLNAKNTADLVRIVMQAQIIPNNTERFHEISGKADMSYSAAF